MKSKTKQVDTKTQSEHLPKEWQERAREVAKQYNLPVPTDQEVGTTEEVEQQLRQAEQEGGQ